MTFNEVTFSMCIYLFVRSIQAKTYLLSLWGASACAIFGLGMASTVMLGSNVYEMSKTFKENGFQHFVDYSAMEKHILKMKLRSCKPIVCKIGGFHYVKKSTTLNRIDNLIDMSVRLLLKF